MLHSCASCSAHRQWYIWGGLLQLLLMHMCHRVALIYPDAPPFPQTPQLAKSDIERAMAHLVEPNANEALSVDARQELDLKIGIAFSRFQTRYFQARHRLPPPPALRPTRHSWVCPPQPLPPPSLPHIPCTHDRPLRTRFLFIFAEMHRGCASLHHAPRPHQDRYRGMDASVISYGPCQTPTLGFCVDRHDAILAFVGEDFWELRVDVLKAGSMVTLEWARGRLFDHEVGVSTTWSTTFAWVTWTG